MKKLKILFISWYYPPQIGGVETIAKIIAEELAKKGMQITVLTSSNKKSIEKHHNLKIIRSPLMKPSNNSINFLAYFKSILKEGFDIVHSHNLSCQFNPKKSLSIIRVCNLLKVPLIEHAHNAQLKTPEKTREIILSDIKIICVSNFVKKRYIELGVNPNNLKVIYNPVDGRLFDPKKVDKRKAQILRKNISPFNLPIIFFPGRVIRISKIEIGEQKQFKTVVEALHKLNNQGIKYVFLIPGLNHQPNTTKKSEKKGKGIIKDYLTNSGVKAYIFKKNIKIEDMPLAYYISDIVCMPSLNETFGMVFAESQAMEKPIIAAKSGAAKELIQNNKTGFLVSPRAVDEVANHLEKLICNPELRKNMGTMGRKRILKMFSKENSIKQIIKLYSENLE